MKRYFSLIENIAGLNAFVYHRTNYDALKDIISKGFSAGSGAMYGTGLYSTYDLDSQLTKKMQQTYGDVIIKFKVNLFKCLILDYDQAKKVYGNNYKVVDQCIEIGILKNPYITVPLNKLSKQLENQNNSQFVWTYIVYTEEKNYFALSNLMNVDEESLHFITQGKDLKRITLAFSKIKKVVMIDPKNELYNKVFMYGSDLDVNLEYTSGIAQDLLRIPEIRGGINGIVFTGRTDGRVCVIYNTDIAIPVSYTITGVFKDSAFFNLYNREDVIWIQGAIDNEYVLSKEDIQKKNYLESHGSKEPWTKVVSLEQIKKSLDASLKQMHVSRAEDLPDKVYWGTHLGRVIEYLFNDDKNGLKDFFTVDLFLLLYDNQFAIPSRYGDAVSIEFSTSKLKAKGIKIKREMDSRVSDVPMYIIESKYISQFISHIEECIIKIFINEKEFEDIYGIKNKEDLFKHFGIYPIPKIPIEFV